MENLLALLMRLMHLYRTSESTGLILRSPDAILRDLLTDVVPQERLEQAVEAIALVDLSSDIGALRVAYTALLQIETLPESVAERIARATRIADTLHALRRAGKGGAVQDICFQIDTGDMFQFVEQWIIGAGPDMPTVILVGGPHKGAQSGEIAVSFPGEGWVEQRTEIVYTANQLYPQINTSLLMFQRNNDRLRKTSMLQRPSPDFDLDLYNYRERKIGTLQTRALHPPLHFSGSGVKITFSTHVPLSFLETRLIHAQGRVVGQAVRIGVSS